MTEALTASIDTATAEVAATEDLVERYQAARDKRVILRDGDLGFKDIQKDVVWKLYEGRTWAEVGALLGITGSRAEAIARSRSSGKGHDIESTDPRA